MSDKTIYTAINNIMDEIGAITKSKKNNQGTGFMYRGVDDVMNALQPLLIKHGVFCVPEVLEHTREERVTKNGGNLIYSILKMKYTFYAADGSSVNTIVIGEGMDSGDKASNKALSIAFKYACFQLFCIPTEEMKDPDSETPPGSIKGITKHIDGKGDSNPEPISKTGKKASEKQLKLIESILSEISKGYAAVGKKVAVDATVQQMKNTLKINEDMTEFSINDASLAIEYLTNIKANIPPPEKTA